MPDRPSRPELFERETELNDLGEHIVGATRRQGSVLFLEGPAGIGKTALLRAARSEAHDHGLTILAATGSELDREFAFGLVHQLIDPVLAGVGKERREELLAGVATLAAPVLLGEEAPALAGSDPAHAVLHGLYWLVANLAEAEPLALIVDDLHWGDRASLRFLEFLGRRLEGLPVLLVVATRTGEPGTEEDVLAGIRSGPAARVLRPSPLSDDAVTRLLTGVLGSQPDLPFAEAALSATGGNPLLVGELARAAAERGLNGDAAEASDLTDIVGTDVGAHVQRRLAALGPDATAVANAVALLGERSRIDDVAALAELEWPAPANAIDLLVQAGLLAGVAPQTTGSAPAFVHPLVRAAVVAEIPPARRAALHATAARRLADRDARPEEIALHLVAAEPAGDRWVVETLRAAARAVAAEGVPESGIVHLRRALAEPAEAEDRVAILGELGTLEAAANRTEALEHLTQALDEGLAESARAKALALRGRLRLYRDAGAALEDLEAAMRQTTDPIAAVRIEAMMLDATMYDLAAHSRRAALLGRDGEPSVARLLHQAVEAGYAPDHRDEVEALARRALDTGDYLAVLGPESSTLHLAVQALRNTELRDLSASVMDDMERAAREAGSRYGLFVTAHSRALWHWFFGSIGAAESDARRASELAREAQLPFGELACSVILAEVLREKGALDDAEALLDAQPIDDSLLASVTGADYLSARGLIHWRRGRREEAEADLRRAHELLYARGWRNPLKGRATLRLAELLAERGEIEEARALAEADIATTSAAGLRGAHGMSLRVLARASEGDEAERLLRDAVAQLEDSPLVHERAWALHDLGAHLRRAGHRTDARTPLREALELAERHEGGEIAALAREELLQSGARPRRSALSGPESLTPSERRTAELAARGLSNREIAETLWVSRKTVEVHLGRTYSKLDISSRAELPVALGER